MSTPAPVGGKEIDAIPTGCSGAADAEPDTPSVAIKSAAVSATRPPHILDVTPTVCVTAPAEPTPARPDTDGFSESARVRKS